MKLEIEHLVPYLPYGLKVRVDYYSQHEGGIFNFSPVILLDFSRDEYIVKPILRPLSDLTKEIEINRETFVFISKIKESQHHLFFREDIKNPILSIQYSEMQKLLEWHFDVFGLIEKGLAIDINYS